MYRTILALTAALPLAFAALPAQAMPAAGALDVDAAPARPHSSREGCGLGFHRGPFGGCRRNGGPIIVARRCPPGFHLGPFGRACRSNF